jgi:hypothetical protein
LPRPTSGHNFNLTKSAAGNPGYLFDQGNQYVWDKCANCNEDIYYSGVDDNVPWVHAHSRNAFCEFARGDFEACDQCGGSGVNHNNPDGRRPCSFCGTTGITRPLHKVDTEAEPKHEEMYPAEKLRAQKVKTAGSPGDHDVDDDGHLYSHDELAMGYPLVLIPRTGEEGRSYCGKARAHPSELSNIEWGEDGASYAIGYGIKPCKECFGKAGIGLPKDVDELYRPCGLCGAADPFCNRCKGSGIEAKYAQETVPADDGPMICHRCGTGTQNQDGVCDKCLSLVETFYDPAERKIAEMQKFPPGEDDDEGNPFMPFSMSELQFVKGPKKRR